jgi:uncharacterized protein (DUF1800 family)
MLKWISFLFLFHSFLVLSAQEKETIGAGNSSSVVVSTSNEQPAQFGTNTLSGVGYLPNLSAASRFLGHATLGADYELIESVSTQGFGNWLDVQFTVPVSFSVLDYMDSLRAMAYDSIFAIGGDSSDLYYNTEFWMHAWWKYVMDSEDLVRARVSYALSQIFVISQIPDLGAYPVTLCHYYDMLISNSFGNFRDLLGEVTRHPAMGRYLTHLKNPKSDIANNRFPDENYAREVMQLFTIGLYELNQDGTRVLDVNNNPIPTYDNNDIAEFAKVFTGYSFGDNVDFYDYSGRESSYTQAMKMFNDWHEPGEKYLLNGFTVPDRNPVDGEADVDDALDNLFNHQNTGPFIGRLLIQRLVKSNPSPAYISRVAAAFANNGSGVRGDMKAVIRAILMDPEARDCSLVSNIYEGMLREPVVRYTNICRAFNAASADGLFRNAMYDFMDHTIQRPLASPSVFNFYQPDYQPIGPVADAGLVAPEFQITNSQSILGFGTHLHDWTFRDNSLTEYWSLFAGETWSAEKMPHLDLTDEDLLAEGKQNNELVDRLNVLLAHGNLSPYTRDVIVSTLSQIPDYEYELRTRMAIFLCMMSPDYLIIR